jgi:uroporphyrinogen decarboxylase
LTLLKLKSDVRRIGARRIPEFEKIARRKGSIMEVTDMWNCLWKIDESKDFYYNQYTFPLKDFPTLTEGLKNYTIPDPGQQIEVIRRDLTEQMQGITDSGIIADRNCAGLTEMSLRIRGYEQWFLDTVTDRDGVKKLLEPDYLRKTVITRFGQLWVYIKKRLPGIKIFMHTCGAVRELLPDLIEAGMDIYNPVQFTASGMDLKGLKKDFGKDLVFWGGGINTQATLRNGTPKEVSDEVKRNLDILAPGGGFVFATVHNIQEDVPPENFWAMWDTLMDYGEY